MYEYISAINCNYSTFRGLNLPRSQVKTSNIINHTKDYQVALSVKLLILNFNEILTVIIIERQLYVYLIMYVVQKMK